MRFVLFSLLLHRDNAISVSVCRRGRVRHARAGSERAVPAEAPPAPAAIPAAAPLQCGAGGYEGGRGECLHGCERGVFGFACIRGCRLSLLLIQWSCV